MRRWWCGRCEVRWSGDDDRCWCCGSPGLLGVPGDHVGGGHEFVQGRTVVTVQGGVIHVSDTVETLT